MTENRIKIAYLIRRYRFRHEEDFEAMQKIRHHEFNVLPLVYPDYEAECEELRKAFANRRAKKKRANAYLQGMFESYDNIQFITLTFTDEALNRLNQKTRHRYVQRWLNEYCNDYFANVDYGKNTGREHYHAVVSLKDLKTKLLWEHGFSNVKKVKIKSQEIDSHKLSSYLLKLSSHTVKLTTGKSFRKKMKENIDNLPF